MDSSTASAWGGLISAGINAAVSLTAKNNFDMVARKDYSYKYATQAIPDNSVAVYNNAYAKIVQRNNALELMHNGEESITAARLKGVKERLAIGISQDEAEANIRMNAAVNGTTGDGVSTSIYQSKANAAYRLADQAVSENNSIEKALADIYKGSYGSNVAKDDYTVSTSFTRPNSSSTVTGATKVPEFSMSNAIMGSIGNLGSNFFKDLGLAFEDSDGVPKQEYAVDDSYTPSSNYIWSD